MRQEIMRHAALAYTRLAQRHRIPPSKHGFSLVLTLTLMVLLSILTVGMLTLSSDALRSKGESAAVPKARANARMALMLAIGELQKQAGPDQRITANSSILSDPDDVASSDIAHPHWTGVWDSWKANDPDVAGGDEPSHHSTLDASENGMHPNYTPHKQEHFRSWLISLTEDQQNDIESARSLILTPNTTPSGLDSSVTLVGSNSVSEEKDQVTASLVDIRSSSGTRTGRFGWWAGDQSVKATIMSDSHEGSALSVADRIFRHQAPGSTGSSRANGLEDVSQTDFRKTPSLRSLDLPENAESPAQRNFHDITLASLGVLADVREGGLKRDLSILLEQDIDISDNGDEHMLYQFSTGAEERVPLQDLSAYYQLYQNDPSGALGRKGGVKFGSIALAGAIQAETPDFGSPDDREKTVREYTTLYRNPIPIRIQYILAVTVVPLDPNLLNTRSREEHNEKDTHLLIPGIMPVITLWNPNSVPLVMGGTEEKSQVFSMGAPPVNFRWRVVRGDGLDQMDGAINFNYMMSGQSSRTGQANSDGDAPRILNLRFGKDEAVVFEPGEVKVFSIPDTPEIYDLLDESEANSSSFGRYLHDAVNDYNPFGFYSCRMGSAPGDGGESWQERGPFQKIKGRTFAYLLSNGYTDATYVGVGATDTIYCHINAEDTGKRGANSALGNEVGGGGFQFSMIDFNNFSPITDRGTPGSTRSDHIRHYQFLSRYGGDLRFSNSANNIAFNRSMISRGFSDPDNPLLGTSEGISVASILNAANNKEVVPIAMFTLRAACEGHASSAGGYDAGRTVASTRPFLHSGIIAPPFIDDVEPEDLYNYGWDWAVERINSVEEAIQVDPGTARTFYGGGYTAELGTTHVVQQEIPVVPPISIAALSHAQLGGFSLANRPFAAEADEYFQSFLWLRGIFSGSYPENRDPDPSGDSYRRTTATGMGGMYPTVMQAIGNSYAHPNLAPDQAFEVVQRTFDNDKGGEQRIFADHSYLANKALWDEFFFSSIIPKPSSTPLHGENLTSKDVAEQFFFEGKALPNQRMLPHMAGLDSDELQSLFTEKDVFTDGLADKIARHLMVHGAFNINSTSENAWRVLLSSMRGKPVQYLENKAATPTEVTPEGTPVGFGSLPSGAPVDGSAMDNPNNPDAWKSWRELTDTEIDELAAAIVRQVKRRGPFLSLSEFVNRRLDGDKELALKGALQAALDDPAVSINKAFRESDRILDNETGVQTGSFAFPEAADGPIAYGSAPYIDQADILRNFASQLAPRGDTFVIRTYGDALDESGKVIARAWCEATVQRIPDYTDSSDDNEVRQNDLASDINKRFGRRIEVISFRWLDPDEV